jgi:hypothetical protein
MELCGGGGGIFLAKKSRALKLNGYRMFAERKDLDSGTLL